MFFDAGGHDAPAASAMLGSQVLLQGHVAQMPAEPLPPPAEVWRQTEQKKATA